MYIARQPIFNKLMKIYGYELLYRDASEAVSFGNASSSAATATVIGGLFEQGINKIVGKAKAFVNFDYDFIMSENIELIDPETLVIEVLETVEVNPVLVERLHYLRAKGYKIALDDFEESLNNYPIVYIADIIKYDIIITPLESIEEEVKEALAQGKVVLAEKIETEEEFQKACDMGFQLFQGYFFSKPKIVYGINSSKASKLQYTMILQELHREEPSYHAIAEVIESDVHFAYRVMKTMSNKKGEDTFRSIKEALVRMGLKELERWINVLMLQDMSEGKPTEIMRLSLVRSKFGEFVANHSIYYKRKDEVAMMCLFSMLDAIMDEPIAEALHGMMLSEDVFNALVHNTGELTIIYEMLTAYEHGDWVKVNEYAIRIQLDTKLLYPGYIETLQWVTNFFDSIE